MVTYVLLNWTDARDYCERHYGGLATLSTDHDRQRLVDIIPRLVQGSNCEEVGGSVTCATPWVGGYKEDENWFWVVPEGKQLFDDQKWTKEFEFGSCVQFDVVDGELETYPCQMKEIFVCNT